MMLKRESHRTAIHSVPKLHVSYLLALLLLFMPQIASAADGVEGVFIKTTCDGKISSAILSSLRREISASPKYRLALTLDDGGQMDIVLAIHIACSERENLAGVASIFGQAKCDGPKTCHLVVDGLSLRSDVCDSSAAAECGRSLFKAFEDYMNSPLAPKPKFN
jgi:hypothetical protein